MKNRYQLKLSDILVTTVVALVFGVIYKLWGPLYYAIKPLGMHLEQLIYGMWFIAATVAFLLIRKPGVGLLAEIAAASGEFFMGSEWGLAVLLSGVAQGLAAELVFAAVGYRKYSVSVAVAAAAAATVGSLLLDSLQGYIGDLALWNLSLLILFRLSGAVIIAGWMGHWLVSALEDAGVADLVRPVGTATVDSN
ncbi:energy-coupling factor transport system substrate-specific component [Fodinibius salinus]|uniref:Energy-coupling factor transport system substrate-specific component n=1 Tax=Fodinibius salinus TaxID=860790 RepID=A0A5D3YMI7_9BACT|nr:ECF transporter S component [Fodinibius salinus]TYP93901.1 energy-coupling factor transport system substrate-specific component [Fodinibius salinus]